MGGYVRKVKTASGATAVQIVEKRGGVRRIVEHVGSAHSDAELAVLMQVARERLHAGQQVLDLELGEDRDVGAADPANSPSGGSLAGAVVVGTATPSAVGRSRRRVRPAGVRRRW